jgi:hypothetical protein
VSKKQEAGKGRCLLTMVSLSTSDVLLCAAVVTRLRSKVDEFLTIGLTTVASVELKSLGSRDDMLLTVGLTTVSKGELPTVDQQPLHRWY